VIALWILHTHAFDAAQITPRLAIVSPEKRCGRSTVLELLSALVRRPLEAASITTAVLFRSIESHGPTLLVDEADSFLRERDDLCGVLDEITAPTVRAFMAVLGKRGIRSRGPVNLLRTLLTAAVETGALEAKRAIDR
jgi:hypothetical protein